MKIGLLSYLVMKNAVKSVPGLALFLEKMNPIFSWSQFGEDLAVIHLLRQKFQKEDAGFYVEVGAYHPRDLSNTLALSLQGWRGINIDAFSESIDIFTQLRPNDINLNYAILLQTKQNHFM